MFRATPQAFADKSEGGGEGEGMGDGGRGGPRESGKECGFSKKLQDGLTSWPLGSAVYSGPAFTPYP